MRIATICALFVFFAGALANGAEPELVHNVVIEDSRIEFHASSSFGKVVGVFHSWEAELERPGGKFEDTLLKLNIAAESVKTGSGLRDKEVKGKNFFAVKEYPEIQFVSKNILAAPEPAKYSMEGELTLRGITKPVMLDVQVEPEEKGREHVAANFTFNRRDFGMTHNPPLNHVADTIRVQIDLEVEEREGAF
jgi:polyisoprenoid-binding protein YceI